MVPKHISGLLKSNLIVAVTSTSIVLVSQNLLSSSRLNAEPKKNLTNDLIVDSIAIVDKNGVKRIELGVNDKGPFIALYDADTKASIDIGIGATSGTKKGEFFPKPRIAFNNIAGTADIEIFSQQDGEKGHSASTVLLSSSSQLGSVSLGVASNGEAGTIIASGKGQSDLSIQSRPAAGSFIFAHDDDGHVRMAMGVNHTLSRYLLELSDGDGKTIWRAMENKVKK